MPNAVLWDFGNVIVRWNPRTLYEKIFPDPVECDRFLTQVCTLAWHTPTDCGVTFAENCAALAARHPHHEAEIWAWHRRWDEMFSGAIAETEAAMEALHARGVPQYGLSVVLLANRQNVGADDRGNFRDLSVLQRAVARAVVSGVEADAAAR